MKRDNIEFMVGWLDAVRRDDREALLATLNADVVWQGSKRRGSAMADTRWSTPSQGTATGGRSMTISFDVEVPKPLLQS